MAYGSLQNTIAANTTSATVPTVGMGATMVSWTDRKAATITAVSKSGKQITVQADTAIRTDDNGMSDAQSYEFVRDEDGMERTYSLRKNGKWVTVGQPAKGGSVALVGVRSHYYDYSF